MGRVSDFCTSLPVLTEVPRQARLLPGLATCSMASPREAALAILQNPTVCCSRFRRMASIPFSTASARARTGIPPNTIAVEKSGLIIGTLNEGGNTGKYCGYTGCGVLYSFSPSTGKFTVLHTFTGGPGDGILPILGSMGAGRGRSMGPLDRSSQSAHKGLPSFPQLAAPKLGLAQTSRPLSAQTAAYFL